MKTKQWVFLSALKTKLARIASASDNSELTKLADVLQRRYAILTDPEIAHTRDALMHMDAARRNIAQGEGWYDYEISPEDLWDDSPVTNEMDDLDITEVTEEEQIVAVISEDVSALTDEIFNYLIGIEDQVNQLVANPQVLATHANIEAVVDSVVNNMEAAKENLVVALTALYTSTWEEMKTDRKTEAA